MTGAVAAAAGGGCHIFSGCGFPAPGLQDFEWKPFFTIGSFSFTKPMLLAILSGAVWDLTGRPALAFVPVAACAAGLVLSAGWMRGKGGRR